MDQSTLLLTRVLAVAYGAAFSYSMIDLVVQDRLKYYLSDQKFTLLVIMGGVLLGLVVLLKIRALTIPGSGHAHDHDHGDDDHDHGVSLWRFIVLAMPLAIIFMGLAPTGLSADVFEKRMTKSQREAISKISDSKLPESRWKWYLDQVDAIETLKAKLDEASSTQEEPLKAAISELDGKMQSRIETTSAKVLQADALDSMQRAHWEDENDPRFARISGQFVPAGYDDRYRLMRIKITCCAADATPVGVSVIGSAKGWSHGDWLEVVGPVQFFESKDPQTGRSTFLPVVHQITAEPTPPKPYLQNDVLE